jgi:predicted RNA-binding Zn-ribbon protein involved in translation (DUF1610 family)
MSISFQCPQCGKKLKAPDEAAGKSSSCPGCGGKVTCPEPVYDAELFDESQPPAGLDPYADLDEGKPYGVAEPQPGAAASAEGRRPCPMCGEMILTTAAKCRYCGEVFDSTLKRGKGSGGKGGKKKELRSIAVSQRYLIICVLVQIIAYIGLIVASASAGNPPKGPAVAVILLLALAMLVTGVAGMVFACMLANKVYGVAGAIFVVILSFVPCVGLITLLVINGKATKILKDKGVHVGFLGADLSGF